MRSIPQLEKPKSTHVVNPIIDLIAAAHVLQCMVILGMVDYWAYHISAFNPEKIKLTTLDQEQTLHHNDQTETDPTASLNGKQHHIAQQDDNTLGL